VVGSCSKKGWMFFDALLEMAISSTFLYSIS
jgi:hypothetical protein